MNGGGLFSPRVLGCLRSPGHGDEAALEESENGLRCPSTGEEFPSIRGIPSLFRPAPWEDASVTDKVRGFYEEHPFPSYEGLEEFGELVNKGHANPFTRNLLRSIGYNKLILECGCGTGQM